MTAIRGLIAVWTMTVLVVAFAVRRYARERRRYVGRHRAARFALSTFQAGQHAASVQRIDAAVDIGPHTAIAREYLDEIRVMRLRSPWGTPEHVDEWVAEHEPIGIWTYHDLTGAAA